MFEQPKFIAKFSKADVLKSLKANREKHIAAHKSMRDQYKTDMVLELKGLLTEVENGKVVRRHFNTSPPKSFVHEYDRAIGMLELSTDEELVLDIETYNAWVNDKWHWRHDYQVSNATYLPHDQDESDAE